MSNSTIGDAPRKSFLQSDFVTYVLVATVVIGFGLDFHQFTSEASQIGAEASPVAYVSGLLAR